MNILLCVHYNRKTAAWARESLLAPDGPGVWQRETKPEVQGLESCGLVTVFPIGTCLAFVRGRAGAPGRAGLWQSTPWRTLGISLAIQTLWLPMARALTLASETCRLEQESAVELGRPSEAGRGNEESVRKLSAASGDM